MPKGQNLTPFQQGVVKRYYDHQDTLMVQKLGEIVSELYLCEDQKKAERLWDRATKALQNTPANPAKVRKALSDRSVELLAGLVTDLTLLKPEKKRFTPEPGKTAAAPIPPDPPAEPQSEDSPPSSEVSSDDLKKAMKAFKKRMKLARLDDESSLGRGAMSSGKQSSIVAITPPRQYPQEVWDELVRRGRLKYAGDGFYQLGT